MSISTERRRPDFKYLVASGLLGFVLGAFVVASLGHPASLPAKSAVATAVSASPSFGRNSRYLLSAVSASSC